MADLVSGRYPQNAAINALFGLQYNSANNGQPVRSNLEYLGLGGGLTDTAASLVSGVMTAVLVPVDPGTTVTKVSVLVGGTGASTPTHSFAALYSGTTVAAPPLIGQSTDGGTAVIAASTRFDFTLTTPQTVTAAQAPNGYIYVAVAVTATTSVPSLITNAGTIASAAQYAWFANSQSGNATGAGGLGVSSGSAVGATAPSTLIWASTKTVHPIVAIW